MDADIHLIQTFLHAAQPIRAFRDQRRPCRASRCAACRRASDGRKAPRSSPQLCKRWIHSQSRRSVLGRPGTRPSAACRRAPPSNPDGFEHLMRHNPVHAGALERDGAHATISQPRDQLLDPGVVAAKTRHVSCGAVRARAHTPNAVHCRRRSPRRRGARPDIPRGPRSGPASFGHRVPSVSPRGDEHDRPGGRVRRFSSRGVPHRTSPMINRQPGATLIVRHYARVKYGR